MKATLFLFTFGILLLSACSSSGERSDTATDKTAAFFDLKGLVASDIEQLQAAGCHAMKSGKVNEQSSTAEVDSINWKRELEAVAMADINKSSWVAHITIDTIQQAEGISLQYRSNNNKIPIRLMIVELDANKSATSVYIERSSKNLIFESAQTIRYQPGKGLEATGSQKALFMSPQTFLITTEFICPNE
jgi:hypothetical protein